MEDTKHDTTQHTRPKPSAEETMIAFLLIGGSALAITLLYWGLFMIPPHVQAWYTTWKVQQVHDACARHNGIDLSRYHLRSNKEEEIMAQCLAIHLPR